MSVWDIVTLIKTRVLQKLPLSTSSSPLWKGILTISAGAAIAQSIGILSAPLITRLYLPNDYGVFALFSSILSILVVTASFRYEFAIPISKDDSEAANLFFLCLMLICVVSMIFLILMIFFGHMLSSFFHFETIYPYFWFLAIGIFGAGIYNILNYWAIRKRDYTRITYTRVSQSLAGSISKIAMGLFGVGTFGLIIGELLSQVTGIGTFLRQVWKKDRDNFKEISLSHIKRSAIQYSKFPLFSLPASVLNSVALQLPVFMLSFIYGFQIVGFYSLAYTVLILPTSFISTSISQVYLGEAAKLILVNPQKLKIMYISITKQLLRIGLPIVIGIALIAPLLFPFIFGDIWKDAGWYCIPLSLVAFSSFVIGPTSNLGTFGFNHWQLGWDILRTCSLLVGFYITLTLNFVPIIALFLYGVIMCLLYALSYQLHIKAIGRLCKNYQKSEMC
jgi:O-antigen/teichoic acid export membrane protein